VFLWWSLEHELDGRAGAGYSRAAARGGSAVWIDSYACLTPLGIPSYRARCARLLAHEVGHALGLQHVDAPLDNLMHYKYGGECLTDEQGTIAQEEARRQFGGR
jgi:hypothetical protein